MFDLFLTYFNPPETYFWPSLMFSGFGALKEVFCFLRLHSRKYHEKSSLGVIFRKFWWILHPPMWTPEGLGQAGPGGILGPWKVWKGLKAWKAWKVWKVWIAFSNLEKASKSPGEKDFLKELRVEFIIFEEKLSPLTSE